jgi:hypothetical protein
LEEKSGERADGACGRGISVLTWRRVALSTEIFRDGTRPSRGGMPLSSIMFMRGVF